MKQPLKTFPPYGRMVAEFEERLGSGGPPDDWRSGVNWTSWRDSLHYVDYAVAALIVVGIVYLVVKRLRGGRGGDAAVGPVEPAADAHGR